MRAFWSIIAMLAAVGVWFALSAPSDRPTPVASPEPPASAPTPAPDSVPAPKPEPAPEPEPPPVAAPEIDLLGEAIAEGLVAPPPPGSGPTRPPIATDTRSPADITRRIDARTIELDGRYRIVGNGSADDPYRISWELLTSASAFIDPAQKALVPPPWVRALDGSYIEISAYYSTALRVQSTRNVLLTFNRWDGCCIGLPPTPFDAIDTTLRAPLDLKGEHLFRYGTFRGKLVVEPFMAGLFLLGLYRLDDASFVTQ